MRGGRRDWTVRMCDQRGMGYRNYVGGRQGECYWRMEDRKRRDMEGDWRGKQVMGNMDDGEGERRGRREER